MSVNFTKEANILAAHGAPTGANTNDCQHRKPGNKSLSSSHIKRDDATLSYLYEDTNNNVQGVYKTIISAISSVNHLVGNSLKKAINLLGNVVIAVNNSCTAGKTRNSLLEKNLDPYSNDYPLIFGAHTGTRSAQGLIPISSPSGFDKNR